LSTFVKEQDEKDRIFSVTYNDLTVEDCKKLDEVRNSWYHRDYFDAIFILAQYLEEKIRQTIFNIFLLLYNSYEKRIKRFDESMRKRIFDNMSKDEKKVSQELSMNYNI
jgi:hypothetical protein